MSNEVKRDDFSGKTKQRIKGHTLQCQLCESYIELGECTHIVSAGKTGPRNKQELVAKGEISDDYDIKSEENGLYLCPNCHTEIDHYPEKYTYKFLKEIYTSWKNRKITVSNFRVENESPQAEKIVKRFECHLCQKNYSSKARLDYHIEHNVCLTKRQKKCHKCGHIFKNIKMLEYHIEHNVCQKKKKQINFLLKPQPVQIDPKSENDALKLAVAELRGENRILKERPQVINNNTFNQANHFTIISDFNTEKVKDTPKLFGDTIDSHLNESVPVSGETSTS